MKKILFVLQAVRSGGSATSMLNLLELLRAEGIECDIFLLERDGCFLKRAEKAGHLLPEEKIISSVLCPQNKLSQKGISSLLIRMRYVLTHKISGVDKAKEIFYKKSAEKLSGKYDTVVAYQESMCTEYVQYIEATKKIAWIHNDYERFSINKTFEQQQMLYDKYNELVCVSEASMESMLKNIEVTSDHIHLIYNTIPRDYIISQSNIQVEKLKRGAFVFISMGRFQEQKGFDRAVWVASKLKEKGINFTWFIIGDGAEFNRIQTLIKEAGLDGTMMLLGVKKNPFPYVKQADCFVMTSRYEAQPMVLNGALTLGIPVISTRFSSAAEVVEDEYNGMIVDNSEAGILNGIEKFIFNQELRCKISDGAKNFVYNNEAIVKQVMDLF